MAGLSVPLDEQVHFDCCMHSPTTGGVTDGDAAPTFDVFEEATDTPILDDQTMTKRTSLTGNYRGTFTASAANGFEVGKWYSVIVTGVVGGVTGKVPALIFRVEAAESVAGVPKVDQSHYLGSASPALVGGRFDSSVGAMAANVLTATAINDDAFTAAKFATGAFTADAFAANALVAATFAAASLNGKGDWNIGKTGYSLTQAFPANFATLAIDASGHVILQDASLVTAKLGTFALAKTTNITGFNDLSAAQVNAEADTALADVGLTITITGRIDAAITTRMASYVQPTGFLAATFPSDPADASVIAGRFDTLDTAVGDVPTVAEFDARTLVAAGYATAAVCTEGRLSELDAANLPTDVANAIAKWTTAMTESYAANGAAMTPVQSLHAIHQMLMAFAIAGVSYTVKKLDGSTTAFVVTLNDATSPTGAART